MGNKLPLPQRIEAAEAYIELVWHKHQDIPAGRGYDSTRTCNWERAKHMDSINFMLDKLSLMYLERDGITIPDTLAPNA